MSLFSKFYTKWGENAFKDNQPDLALKMVNRAIKSDSGDLNAYILKIAILSRMAQPEEALKTLDLAIETNIENKKIIDALTQFRQPLVEYVKGANDIRAGKGYNMTKDI